MTERVENSNKLEWKLITLDFDTKTDPNIKRACEYLKRSQYRSSASKRGIHVRGFALCNNPLEIRELLGDDPIRIKLDRRIMERPQGTLWDTKIINGVRHEVGQWIDYK